jgi:hypothetical protein
MLAYNNQMTVMSKPSRPADEIEFKKREEALRSRIMELASALQYYANPATYRDGEYGYQLMAPIDFDRGEQARAAIRGYEHEPV